MAIEITSGGVTKTYRYYPYDAFYVDTSGNVNASGQGQQVKETWFNGVKYYPESFDGYQWMGESSGSTIISNKNCHASFTRRWNWYVQGNDYTIMFDTPNSWTLSPSKMSNMDSGVLSSKMFNWDIPYPNPHLIVFEEECVVTADFGDFAWICEYMTSDGQAVFDALSSGIIINSLINNSLPREFDVISTGAVPTGKKESDMDVNGLFVDVTGNIQLYCTGFGVDATRDGVYGYKAFYPQLRVYMPIDVDKCQNSEYIRISSYIQIPNNYPYLWFSISLASRVAVRFESYGIQALSNKPVPFQHTVGWDSRSENYTYMLVSQ